MVVYKTSDIRYSWEIKDSEENHPKVCGYIKEGEGNKMLISEYPSREKVRRNVESLKETQPEFF